MIREAGINDRALLSQLISESFRDIAERFSLTRDNCPKHPSNCTVSWIENDIDRGVRYFILYRDERPAGCVGVEHAGNGVCYLERLSVLPEMRGRHFGSDLVRHALNFSASRGAVKVGIGIIAQQTELKEWYKKFGFMEVQTKTFPHLPFDVCLMEYETKKIPVVETERLVLRPFALGDAPEVQRLAGDKSVADTVLNIPHPYGDGVAEEWISTHQDEFDNGKSVTFAITDKADGSLVGAISLMGITGHHEAELGYWIGRPFWNDGRCTEAAKAVLRYGFTGLGLHRIHAQHMSRNPASGQVMHKLGMLHEGTRKQHVRKGDRFEDMELYDILKEEWNTRVGIGIDAE